MNSELLVSDAHHFRVDYRINPYMDTAVQPDAVAAAAEHQAVVAAHLAAGRKIEYLPSAPECPDMVFTANAAVVRGDRAVLGRPPAERAAEIPYAAEWLADHGYETLTTPWAFSGQGDALSCGDLLLVGLGQRTDDRAAGWLARELDCEAVPLRTAGPRWYDLDLAVGVLSEQALAYCPEALDARSVRTLRGLGVELVEVAVEEAARFALNLVSDGTTVTMTSRAPLLAAVLRDRGLRVIELDTTELAKGGGGIRCTALTLDNAVNLDQSPTSR